MRAILAIALNDIRITFSERSTWFVMFLLPLLSTAVLALAGGASGDQRATLFVVNEDAGPLGAQVVRELAASEVVRLAEASDGQPPTRAVALAALEDYNRVLVLPASFSEAILVGEPVEPVLHLGDSATLEQTQAVRQVLEAMFARMEAAAQAARVATEQATQRRSFADDAERSAFFDATLARARARLTEGALTVERERASATEPAATQVRGAAQSSPGQLVTYALVTLLNTATVFVAERTEGTLPRLLIAPLSRRKILAGKALGRLTIGLLQMAVLIGAGTILFGVAWGRSPLALGVLVLAFALAATGLGLFLATVARTPDQANQMATGASMMLAAVGGAWWSLEIVEGPLRTLAMLLPTGWAMEGFQSIILRGAGLPDVGTNVAVLLGFALLFFTLGSQRLRWV